MTKTNIAAPVAIEMSPVVPGSNVGLVDLRNDLLNTIAESGKAVDLKADDYAAGLNATFSFDWFYIETKDEGKSPEGKLIRPERKALSDGLKELGHANPSVFWGRVKAKAEKLRYPEKVAKRETEAAEAAESEGKGESDSKGASRNRSPLVRNGEEIAALVKFNDGLDLEGADGKLKPVQALLKQALALIYQPIS